MRLPSDSKAQSLPALDVEETYIAELCGIEEREYHGPTRYFDDGREAKNTNSVIWKFRLTDADGTLVTTPEGEDYVLWSFTSDSTFLDPKGARTARARTYMHALAGRELTDDQVNHLLVDTDGNPTLPTKLIGRKVRIEVKLYTATDSNQRWQIERMRPLKEQPVQVVRMPVAAAIPARAPVAAVADDDDLPF